MEPIGWSMNDGVADWYSLIHAAKWRKNEVTGKEDGGPRFGVMVLEATH
eukprot:COSAG04_NODE_3715_length_2586_cov_1.247688_2_plen_48_part_01